MAIYPNEAYPADGVVAALNGQVDAGTGLAYIARGVNGNSSPPYEIQYNRRLLRQNRMLAVLRQGMVVDEGGLKIGVYPIKYTLGGARKSFDGATGVGVPDNATRVVYLDSANQLQVALAFPASLATFLPLATVVTAGGVMSVTDERAMVLYAV